MNKDSLWCGFNCAKNTALEKKADSKLLKLLGIQPKMPGFHILSQMPAQHNKIKVPVEELSMQRPSELKQDFDWYYTNTAKRIC